MRSLQQAIREVWRKTFHTSVSNDFASYIPASEDDVEACEVGKDSPGEAIQLDFSKGYSGSRWNRIILRRIYDIMLAAREKHGGWGLPDVSEGYIMAELQGQLKRSQEAWALVQPRILPKSGESETQEQVAERVRKQNEKRMTDVGGRSLRKRVSHAWEVSLLYLTVDDRNLTNE
jgi:hypothetical protein